MRKIKLLSFSFPAVILTFASFPSAAQVVDISECRAIEDRLARFDCYEALAGEQEKTPASTPSATESATVESESRMPPVPAPAIAEEMPDAESFGRQDNTRVVQGEDGSFELLGTVADLKHYVPNMWLITLENGQQWRQMVGRKYFLREGDEVRIYPSGWGDKYRLAATRLTGFIQVERVD